MNDYSFTPFGKVISWTLLMAVFLGLFALSIHAYGIDKTLLLLLWLYAFSGTAFAIIAVLGFAFKWVQHRSWREAVTAVLGRHPLLYSFFVASGLTMAIVLFRDVIWGKEMLLLFLVLLGVFSSATVKLLSERRKEA